MSNINEMQKGDFNQTLFGSGWVLEDAIEWIRDNLYPEDVFDREQLDDWAIDSGYTLE